MRGVKSPRGRGRSMHIAAEGADLACSPRRPAAHILSASQAWPPRAMDRRCRPLPATDEVARRSAPSAIRPAKVGHASPPHPQLPPGMPRRAPCAGACRRARSCAAVGRPRNRPRPNRPRPRRLPPSRLRPSWRHPSRRQLPGHHAASGGAAAGGGPRGLQDRARRYLEGLRGRAHRGRASRAATAPGAACATRCANAPALLEPRLKQITDRLAELGAAPAAGAAPEDATVAGERSRLSATQTEFDGAVKQARLLAGRGDELADRINARRRQIFTDRLFAHSANLFDPGFWAGAAAAVPGEIRTVALDPEIVDGRRPGHLRSDERAGGGRDARRHRRRSRG